MVAQWIQAVIDLPASSFERGAEFWRAASASQFGDIHPDHDEFVHLVPSTGDMHLELQRIDDGPAGVHIDLLVEDIGTEADRAVALGAHVLTQPGHAVLESPGGMRFCIVPYSGESARAAPVARPAPHAIDLICIDAPAADFDREVAFWSDLTGWPLAHDETDEFQTLARPPTMPIMLLVQRLGPDDTGGTRAHLDVSCGEDVDALVEAHVELGASVIDRRERWTVMADPVGMPYCLTRSPVTA